MIEQLVWNIGNLKYAKTISEDGKTLYDFKKFFGALKSFASSLKKVAIIQKDPNCFIAIGIFFYLLIFYS